MLCGRGGQRETQDARRKSLFDWPVAFTKRERERQRQRQRDRDRERKKRGLRISKFALSLIVFK